MSIESVMPSNHLVLCHPLLLLPSIFPSIRVFSKESAMSGQSIGSSALALILLMWFPLGLTGLMILQSKGLSRVLCSTTIQKLQFFGAQPPLWSLRCTWSDYKIVRSLWQQPWETLLMPPQLAFLYSSFRLLGGDARNPLPQFPFAFRVSVWLSVGHWDLRGNLIELPKMTFLPDKRDEMEHRLLAAHYFLLLVAFLSRPEAWTDCSLPSSMTGCCVFLRMAEDKGESWCLLMKWSFEGRV